MIRRAPELRHYLWIFSGLILSLLPHATRFSPVIIACFVALGGWRLLAYLHKLPLPGPKHRVLWLIKLLFALAACLAVLVSFRGQPGRDAGVALLTVRAGLKLTELKASRDFYIVSCLGYFFIVTNFLYSQTIMTVSFLFAVVVVITAGLVDYNLRSGASRAGWCLHRAGLITLQALPIAIIAFILFPRVEGPLWGRPLDPARAVSGLSDEMSPGTITSLSLSDEVAFRVQFEGALPPAADRYWRGPVMWNTDGRTWRLGTAGIGRPYPTLSFGGAYRYTVTLEPHGKRWLFALEMPSHTGPRARSQRDMLLLSRFRVRNRLAYTLTSHTDYRISDISSEELNAALALPASAHPRSRELANQWRREATSARDVINAALSFFNKESFFYTLTPPALGADPVDDFLFATRAGFCEHYASSFVTLMRAAGIPARVVTGYQGGELNPIGDYLIVRQRDAHAWAEVWLDGAGWVRIDPTAAVAPERLSRGINEMLPSRSRSIVQDLPATAAIWRRLSNSWDAVNYRWSQWVLGYTPTRQRSFLSKVGFGDISAGALAGLMITATGILLAAVALSPRNPRRRSRDQVAAAYQRFCRKLARAGLVRRSNEGPLDFAARISRLRADLRQSVSRITELYILLRYGKQQHDADEFTRLVRNFRTSR